MLRLHENLIDAGSFDSDNWVDFSSKYPIERGMRACSGENCNISLMDATVTRKRTV